MEWLCRYPADLHAPRVARLGAREALADHLDEDTLGDVELLITELVTDSVRHAQLGPHDEVTLNGSVSGRLLRIAVSDPGPGSDAAVVDGVDRHRAGRWGLRLAQQMSDRWGHVTELVSTVWLEIDLPGKAEPS